MHAVEVDPDALVWARRNVASHGGRVLLHAADVRAPDLLPGLAGRVDLVVCNPPYVPDATPVAARGAARATRRWPSSAAPTGW